MPDRYDTRWARSPQRQQPWRPLLTGILLLVAVAGFAFRYEVSSAARGLLAFVWSAGAATMIGADSAAEAADAQADAAEARRAGSGSRGRAARRVAEPDSGAHLVEALPPGQPRLSASPVGPPPPGVLTLRKPIPFPGEVVEAMLSSPVPPQSFPPRLQNPEQVVDLVYQHYPQRLREAGFGGRVVLALVVDATGSVRQQRVASPSNFSELNAAALEVGRRMEFSPARQLGRNVESHLMFPVVFRP